MLKISDEKLMALPEFASSPLFSDAEKSALRFTEEMSQTSVNVPDEVFEAVRRHFSPPEIVELSAMIAMENMRARFNRSLLIEAEGFCMLPESHPVQAAASG